MSVPTTTPAEVLDISPEGLEIANAYLQTQDINLVASDLDIPVELVTQFLVKREVKTYIDQVFFNLGFNNRFKMAAAMDAIIKKKFEELSESEMGSTKDIADLLKLKHDMTMSELDRQIKLETLRQSNIKNQVNVQINEGFSDGTKYGDLIQKLMSGNSV